MRWPVLLLFVRQEHHRVSSPICAAKPCADASAHLSNRAGTGCSKHACTNACTDNRADLSQHAGAHGSANTGADTGAYIARWRL